MKQAAKFRIGTLIIALSLGWLVVNGMRSSTLRSIPVSQLRATDYSSRSNVGQHLRVAGFVGTEPVRQERVQTPHGSVNVNHFTVTDHDHVVSVEYRDALPDTFRPGGPVQVDGEYFAPGKMRAQHVFTKCPSKYDSESKDAMGKSQQDGPKLRASLENQRRSVNP